MSKEMLAALLAGAAHFLMTPDEIEALYRDHGDVVLRRATAILGNIEEAREVLHDLFVSLVEKPERFRKESSPMTFLYAATTHRALRRLRDGKNRSRIIDERVKPQTADHDPARAETLAMLRDILRRLPDKLALVATYCYFDGMSHDEIAEVLGCSRRQVGKLLEKFHARASKIAHALPLAPVGA